MQDQPRNRNITRTLSYKFFCHFSTISSKLENLLTLIFIRLTRLFIAIYCTDLSKVVVSALVLCFVALWFILRGDLFYVLPCVLFLCFSVLLEMRLPRLRKSELILFFSYVCLICACLDFLGFLLFLVSGKGCGL